MTSIERFRGLDHDKVWRISAIVVLMGLLCASARPARADLWWDSDGATAGATGSTTAIGTWGTNNFWSTSSTGNVATGAWTSGETAVFSAGTDATGTYTVTVSGTQTIGGIRFEEGAVTLSGGTLAANAGATITRSGTGIGQNTIASPITGNGLLTLVGTGTDIVFLNGVISDSGGARSLEINSGGSVNWALNAAHTYSGGTTITAASEVTAIVSSSGPAGAPTSGPFGTGTLVLTSGTMRATTSGPRTVGNPVTLAGNFTFGNSASLNSLTFSGPLTLTGNRQFTVTNAPVIFSGALGDGGGGFGFTKLGGQRLELNNSNTFTGGVTISEGELRLGHAGALNSTTPNTVSFGSNANSKVLTLDGNSVTVRGLTTGATVGTSVVQNNHASTAVTLTVNNTVNNAFAGVLRDGSTAALALVKTGTGALSLSGANLYTGGTTLSQGTLNINSSTALGATAGTFVIGNGTTINNSSGLVITNANNNAIVIDGDFTFTGSNTLNLGTGAVSLGTAAGTTRSIAANALTLTLGGTISDGTTANSIVKSGAGALVFGGNNTYTGTTAVNNGRLTLTHSNALGSNAAGITVAASSADATLALDGGITVAGENITQIGNTGVTGTIQNVSGNNTWTGNITKGGVLVLESLAGSLNITGNIDGTANSVRLNGAGSGEVSGSILTAFQVEKNNGGTWTLSGANSYTTATNILGGTLLLNGSHTGGALYTVASGATFGGTGSTTSSLTVNAGGFLAPGTSIESLGVGSATINGTLKIEIDDTNANVVDLLNVTAALNITNAKVDFDITGLPTAAAYVFASYGSLTGTFTPVNIIDMPVNYYIDYNYQSANQIALVQVPEPGSFTILLLGSVATWYRRKRLC